MNINLKPHNPLAPYFDLFTSTAPDVLHINICYQFIVVFSHFSLSFIRSRASPFYCFTKRTERVPGT